MADSSLAEAIRATLESILETDPQVIVLGEDIGRSGGVFRITSGLQERFGVERVIDTPLAESGIVGTAIGLALGGPRPIVEIQFMGFSYPAFDQIISHVARLRNRSRGRFTVPIVIRMPYGGGFGAAEHHSESTEALYAQIPGLKVVVPSTPSDAAGLLRAAVADPDPVMYLEPIRLYRSAKQQLDQEAAVVPIGPAAIRRDGSDLAVVAWGACVPDALAAADILADKGIEATVIDLRSLAPWDSDTVINATRRTGRLLIVHEAPRTGGFGAEIAATVQREALYQLLSPIERVTGWDVTIPLRRNEHLYMPDTQRIVRAAIRLLGNP